MATYLLDTTVIIDFLNGKRRHISLGDVTVAATALAYGLVLMTDNAKHFPMTELARYPLPAQEIP